jgi:hypothetical protein
MHSDQRGCIHSPVAAAGSRSANLGSSIRPPTRCRRQALRINDKLRHVWHVCSSAVQTARTWPHNRQIVNVDYVQRCTDSERNRSEHILRLFPHERELIRASSHSGSMLQKQRAEEPEVGSPVLLRRLTSCSETARRAPRSNG